jgi:hypothetical protein
MRGDRLLRDEDRHVAVADERQVSRQLLCQRMQLRRGEDACGYAADSSYQRSGISGLLTCAAVSSTANAVREI